MQRFIRIGLPGKNQRGGLKDIFFLKTLELLRTYFFEKTLEFLKGLLLYPWKLLSTESFTPENPGISERFVTLPLEVVVNRKLHS